MKNKYPSWKRSQNSNGYYIRKSSGQVIFIRIERNEISNNQTVYDVMRREGLSGSPHYTHREYTLAKARSWMMKYMKSHPYGW